MMIAITAVDIKKAMNQLINPNENEAKAVDVRQELDLKVRIRTQGYVVRCGVHRSAAHLLGFKRNTFKENMETWTRVWYRLGPVRRRRNYNMDTRTMI
jgi:hypothetical protein